MKIRKKLILSFLMVIVLPMRVLAVVTTRMINCSMEESTQEAINQNLKAALIQFYVRGDQMKFEVPKPPTPAPTPAPKGICGPNALLAIALLPLAAYVLRRK